MELSSGLHKMLPALCTLCAAPLPCAQWLGCRSICHQNHDFVVLTRTAADDFGDTYII